MTIHERESRFKLFGKDFGSKPGNIITSSEPLPVREEFVGNDFKVSLRGSGKWQGGYIKVIDGDHVILGRSYSNTIARLTTRLGMETTLTKGNINKHPLVGKLLIWKPSH